MVERRLSLLLRRLIILGVDFLTVGNGVEIDGQAHGSVQRRLAEVVVVERIVVIRLRRDELFVGVRHVEVRADTRRVAHLRNLEVLDGMLDGDARRLDVLLRRQKTQVRRLHVERNLLARVLRRLLQLVHRRTLLVHLRLRHVVVKGRPVRLYADRPCVRRIRVVGKEAVAADRAGCRCADLRQRSAARRLHGSVRLTHGIVRRDAVRTVRERVLRAVLKAQIILSVGEFVRQRELRARRQADDLVEFGNGDVVVVRHVHETLLSVRERDLGCEHIGTRDRAHLVLRVDICQMTLQIGDGHLADLDEIAVFERLEILSRRLVTHRLLRAFEREIGIVHAVARRLDAALDAAARVEREGKRRAAPKSIVVVVHLVCLAADAVALRRERELRACRAARLMVCPVRRIHIGHGRLDRAIVLKRQFHALGECERARLRCGRRCEAQGEEPARDERRKLLGKIF